MARVALPSREEGPKGPTSTSHETEGEGKVSELRSISVWQASLSFQAMRSRANEIRAAIERHGQFKEFIDAGPPWTGDSGFSDEGTVKSAGGRWHAESKKWKASDETSLIALIQSGAWCPVDHDSAFANGVVSFIQRGKEAADTDAQRQERSSAARFSVGERVVAIDFVERAPGFEVEITEIKPFPDDTTCNQAVVSYVSSTGEVPALCMPLPALLPLQHVPSLCPAEKE